MTTLVAVLEEARDLGFLGPGPVAFHVEHAQAYLGALEGVRGDALDLGAGGGVPGLILAGGSGWAVYVPQASKNKDLAWTFVDAMAKRTAFLERAVTALGLDVEVLTGRAEELGRVHRGRYQAVVARSFGGPAVTAECAAPFLAIGGRLIVSEPPGGGDRWSPAGLAELGLGAVTTFAGPPALAVAIQEAACPDRYPRRTGVPTKRPLW